MQRGNNSNGEYIERTDNRDNNIAIGNKSMHFASLSTTNAQLEMHERETVTEEMNTLLQEAVVWQTTVWILIPQNSHTWRSEQNK